MNRREHEDNDNDDVEAEPREQSRPAQGASGATQYRMPEAEHYLRRAVELLESAPGIPMSASVRVNREEILELLDEVVARMPDEVRSARWLLKEREEFLARTRREADDLIAEATAQVAQMVQRTEVNKAADVRARQIIEEAEGVSRRMRRETEDYCDQRLASFENVLAKIQKSVVAGRQRLAAPTIEEAELGGFEDLEADTAPEHREP